MRLRTFPAPVPLQLILIFLAADSYGTITNTGRTQTGLSGFGHGRTECDHTIESGHRKSTSADGYAEDGATAAKAR